MNEQHNPFTLGGFFGEPHTEKSPTDLFEHAKVMWADGFLPVAAHYFKEMLEAGRLTASQRGLAQKRLEAWNRLPEYGSALDSAFEDKQDIQTVLSVRGRIRNDLDTKSEWCGVTQISRADECAKDWDNINRLVNCNKLKEAEELNNKLLKMLPKSDSLKQKQKEIHLEIIKQDIENWLDNADKALQDIDSFNWADNHARVSAILEQLDLEEQNRSYLQKIIDESDTQCRQLFINEARELAKYGYFGCATDLMDGFIDCLEQHKYDTNKEKSFREELKKQQTDFFSCYACLTREKNTGDWEAASNSFDNLSKLSPEWAKTHIAHGKELKRKKEKLAGLLKQLSDNCSRPLKFSWLRMSDPSLKVPESLKRTQKKKNTSAIIAWLCLIALIVLSVEYYRHASKIVELFLTT
ncbi:MAG: hypothetical protein WCH07_03275 [Deltaproteobacteria bacterium]